jgi:hypothetical protein
VACARMKKNDDDHHKRVQLRVRVNGKVYDLGGHEDDESEEEKPHGGHYGGHGSEKKHDVHWEEDALDDDSSE